MELDIKIMSLADNMASILNFQTDDTSIYWREPLFNAYPFLDKEKCFNLCWKERQKYLTTEFTKFYNKIKLNLQNKCTTSQKIWNENKKNINNIYSKVFEIDCQQILNDMVAEIALNPICPRDIQNKRFLVFWNGDELNFIKTSLHEIIHFVWFYIWQNHFKDNIKEYEAPDLKWILSEMVIDTLVKKSDIGKLYPESYQAKPAYSYFYDMQINNKLVLDELSSIYINAQNIIQFMEQAYLYCQINEKEIRRQIL